MKVSDRIAGLTGGGSDGWDLFRKAKEMKQAGLDVTELTIGEHDHRTDPSILAEMYASARDGHTGYATLPGINALRDKIAERVAERTGVTTTRENVIVTAGGQAALFAAHIATCDPGDRALFIDPYYATYPGTIRATGAIAEPILSHAEFGFQPVEADLRAAPEATSLLINSPNNPTGAVYGRETQETIARFVCDRDIWLISDEVYDTMIWEGEHLSPRTLPDMAERTLVIGSLSKSHAMTGSRLGWVVGPGEVLEHLINLTTHTTYGVPGYIQDAGLFALNQGLALEEKVAAPFRRRHNAVCGLLTTRGIPIVPSAASMYVMADIRMTGLSGEEFGALLLKKHLVAVMPGESFGQAAAGHLRIALTVDDARLMRAIETLADVYGELLRSAA